MNLNDKVYIIKYINGYNHGNPYDPDIVIFEDKYFNSYNNALEYAKSKGLHYDNYEIDTIYLGIAENKELSYNQKIDKIVKETDNLIIETLKEYDTSDLEEIIIRLVCNHTFTSNDSIQNLIYSLERLMWEVE